MQVQNANKDAIFLIFKLSFINYLRVVIVAETFSEGVMVYFQLSDLCEEEEEEGNERKSASGVRDDRGGLRSINQEKKILVFCSSQTVYQREPNSSFLLKTLTRTKCV